MLDLVIIGAGPLGLATGIAAKRAGFKALIIDKGALVNSFVNYPTDIEFFSTPELLEIGNIPFVTRNYKPVRAEAVEYYRQAALKEELNINLYEKVTGLAGGDNNFEVITEKGRYQTKKVVIATGFFDIANKLGIPGEDLPNVTHYYKEAFPYALQKILIIGGKNSAAKVALDCFRHGAEVTMAIRGPSISDRVKYWIRPDLENRIKEGKIRAFYNTTVCKITEDTVVLNAPEGKITIDNNFVLAMTGYQPDFDLLSKLGISFDGTQWKTPIHDRETMETNNAGVYLAGVICGGMRTGVWFIENSRIHADKIIDHLQSKRILKKIA